MGTGKKVNFEFKATPELEDFINFLIELLEKRIKKVDEDLKKYFLEILTTDKYDNAQKLEKKFSEDDEKYFYDRQRLVGDKRTCEFLLNLLYDALNSKTILREA